MTHDTLHYQHSDRPHRPDSLRLVGLPEPSMVQAETEAQRERRQAAVIQLKHDKGNAKLAKDLGLISPAEAFDCTAKAYAKYWRTIDHG